MSSRLPAVAFEQATGATAEVFQRIKKSVGRVPNAYATLGTHAPAALAVMLQADAVLTSGALSRQDQELIKLVVSEAAGCDYCVAAHTLVGKMTGLAPEAMRQARHGKPTGDARQDALVRFLNVLIRRPGTIPQAEYDAIRAAGYDERQLADIALAVAVITFTNVFNRINDTDVDFPAVAA